MNSKNNIEFSLYVEMHALDNRLNLSDALLEIMDTKDLDESRIAESLTESLKQKLYQEYKQKKML